MKSDNASLMVMLRCVFLMLCSLNLSSCQTAFEYPVVRFVVTDSFSGPLIIIEDSQSPPIEVKSGVAEFSIPASGVLRVQSTERLHHLSTMQVNRIGGEKIPLDHEALPSQVAFRGGTLMQASDSEPYYGFFIGTESAQHAFDFATIRPVLGSNMQSLPHTGR